MPELIAVLRKCVSGTIPRFHQLLLNFAQLGRRLLMEFVANIQGNATTKVRMVCAV